jgi:hypothetical protein
MVLPLVGIDFLAGGEDAIGYRGGFNSGADVMGAEDVDAGGGYDVYFVLVVLP